jgi:hypothetical protein
VPDNKEKPIGWYVSLAGLVAAGLLPLARSGDGDNQPYYETVIKEQTEQFYQRQLEDYWQRIDQVYERYEPVIRQNRYFGFAGLTVQQQVDDFRIYFPIYHAAELEYGIPWELMWVSHVLETLVSRHETPEIGGVGAMQRNDYFYPKSVVIQAVQGYEFLRQIEGQRYTPDVGDFPTYDSDEILWAASKIHNDAQKILAFNPGIDWQEAVRRALYSYCSESCAAYRFNEFEIFSYKLQEDLHRWEGMTAK